MKISVLKFVKGGEATSCGNAPHEVYLFDEVYGEEKYLVEGTLTKEEAINNALLDKAFIDACEENLSFSDLGLPEVEASYFDEEKSKEIYISLKTLNEFNDRKYNGLFVENAQEIRDNVAGEALSRYNIVYEV